MAVSNIALFSRSAIKGGIERNIVRQADILKEAGLNIFVIAFKKSSIAKTFTHSGIELLTVENEKILTIWKLNKELKNKKIDILFLYRTGDLKFGFLLKLFSGFKLKTVFYQQERVKLNRYIFLKSLLIKWTDFWLSPMSYLGHEISDQLILKKKDIYVVPHCINLTRFLANPVSSEEARKQLNLPADRRIIGILGRQNLEKRQDFLIRAINFLQLHDFSYDVLIMGNPTEKEEVEYLQFLKELAAECRLEKQVHFRSNIDDIQIFFKAIDIYVLTTSGEACDITAIEAFASATPVLAVKSNYNSELVENGTLGMLYKANDLEDFSGKLIRMLTSDEIKLYLAEEGIRNVKEKYDSSNHPLISFATDLQANKKISGLVPVEADA